jgi:hypothetical protein
MNKISTLSLAAALGLAASMAYAQPPVGNHPDVSYETHRDVVAAPAEHAAPSAKPVEKSEGHKKHHRHKEHAKHEKKHDEKKNDKTGQ